VDDLRIGLKSGRLKPTSLGEIDQQPVTTADVEKLAPLLWAGAPEQSRVADLEHCLGVAPAQGGGRLAHRGEQEGEQQQVEGQAAELQTAAALSRKRQREGVGGQPGGWPT
jgi:hypothetical protein